MYSVPRLLAEVKQQIAAWLAGGAEAAVNPRSWGVVFSGNFDVARPIEEQVQSFRWLRVYSDEVKPGLLVTGHRDHGAKSCPGKNLKLSDLA